jgi:hypothetical protein
VKRDPLLLALLALAAATLLHHVHNAEFLEHYPGMPAWLTARAVYAAWVAAAAVGACGYWLLRRGHSITGTAMVIAYACYGIDGLVHYALAPVSAHTAAMNVSIWLEALAATGLIAAIALRNKKVLTPFR